MQDGSGKNIYFFFNGVTLTLQNRKELKRFLISIFSSENVELSSVSYIFSTDKTLYNINKRFLNHEFFTDIITFPLSTKKDATVADVYISVDRVRENARLQNEPFQRELHRVIFHGALHLCGYKDKSRREINKMRERENYYLSRYFG